MNAWHQMSPAEQDEHRKFIRERQLEAFRLRTEEGLTYQQIADRMKVHVNVAYRDVKACARKIYEKEYKEVVTHKVVDVYRLDRMLSALKPQTDAGNVKAVMAAARLIAERAKLLGLYTPTKHMVAVLQAGEKIRHGIDAPIEDRLIALFEKLDRIKAPISPALREAAVKAMNRQKQLTAGQAEPANAEEILDADVTAEVYGSPEENSAEVPPDAHAHAGEDDRVIGADPADLRPPDPGDYPDE